MNGNDIRIEVEGGKYVFIVDCSGEVRCERFGEPWLIFDVGGKALIALIYKFSEIKNKLEAIQAKLRSVCLHRRTHFEDWPDGGRIEICDDCGMSRYQWEQGESLWIMVEDIPKVRKELEEQLEGIRKNIKFEEGGRIGIGIEAGRKTFQTTISKNGKLRG